jgi:hypothetical protein
VDTFKVGDEVKVVFVCGDKGVLRATVVSVEVTDFDLTQDAAVGLVSKHQPDFTLIGDGADELVADRVFRAMNDRSPETGIFVLSHLAKAPPC